MPSCLPGLILCLAVAIPAVSAAVPFRGVNLSAAEFGFFGDSPEVLADNRLPGVHGVDYRYADPADFDGFVAQGLNTFRIPFRWERIQPAPGGALDGAELGRLRDVVNYATGLGANVILDVHNYARFHAGSEVAVLGSPELPTAGFSDLWTRLATEFQTNSHVVFGLMNEPYGTTTQNVVDFTNAALAAIRATGATNLALIQGNGFSGAHSWFQDWYGTANASAMLDIVDPGHNLAFEVHQYLDNEGSLETRYSGLTDHVESATVAVEKLAPFTDWLRMNQLRGFLGEIGAPSSELGVEALFNGIQHVEQNSDVWLGWALWAGGPWWDDPNAGSRYHLSVNPLPDGSTAPQLAALQPFLVPEPATWLLLVAAGLAGLVVKGCRRA